MKAQYKCSGKIEYSACSWEKGWNIKFRKAGRTLCTIYPKEGYFRVMVVIGTKEKEAVQAELADYTAELREIYGLYRDVLRLIEIRRG